MNFHVPPKSRDGFGIVLKSHPDLANESIPALVGCQEELAGLSGLIFIIGREPKKIGIRKATGARMSLITGLITSASLHPAILDNVPMGIYSGRRGNVGI